MDPAFKVRRRQALAAMVTALEADDEDAYCKGYDELVAAEKDAGEFDEHMPGICRVCGCTDEYACDGGCEWVDAEHTLCSSCVDKVPGFASEGSVTDDDDPAGGERDPARADRLRPADGAQTP